MAAKAFFAVRSRQLGLLMKKNLIIAKRNRISTLAEILVPFVFVCLLFIIDLSLRSQQALEDAYKNVESQPSRTVSKIPRCVVGPEKSSCVTLALVNHNKTGVGQAVFRQILADNDIPLSETKEFDTEDQLDDYLMVNVNDTLGAYIFKYGCVNGTCTFQYGLQYNVSGIYSRGIRINTDTWVGTPMRVAAQRAALRNVSGDGEMSLTVREIEYPHPEVVIVDVVATQGPVFFFGALCFNFVIQLGSIVMEKERKLRQYLSMMGLKDSTYWFSWFITNSLFNILSVIVLIISGLIFQMDFFLLNDFGTYFFLFALFSVAMVPLTFFVSIMVGKTRNALLIGFGLFLFGVILQNFATFIYAEDADPVYKWVLSWFPFVILAKGTFDVGGASTGAGAEGMRWGNRFDNAFFSLENCYQWMGIDLCLFYVLTWYLDSIFGEQKRKPWFFLMGSYWIGEARISGEDAVAALRRVSSVVSSRALQRRQTDLAYAEAGLRLDDDVAAERHTVRTNSQPADSIVLIKNLRKAFGQGQYRQWAVNDVSVFIRTGQLFCLLGHNGAGKTTIINMLIGLLKPTSGFLEIAGHSIPDEMDTVREFMGVCPQHDVLWGELTAAEHIAMMAALKGMQPERIDEEIEERLKDVALVKARDMTTMGFSGGMRRRLSVALALTASPSIVFLDEPTTGMDPVSRRQVWQLIERIKSDRGVVLTTHSMEEADVLGDKIAVMTQGKLSAVGTSLRLKNKFGEGYTLSVFVDPQFRESAAAFIEKLMSGVQRKAGDENRLEFNISMAEEAQMSAFFEKIHNAKEELHIREFLVSMATLEDVFLNIAQVHHTRQLQPMMAAGQGVGIVVEQPVAATASSTQPTVQVAPA